MTVTTGGTPLRAVAIVNQKGGVGKSTTTINLGAALAALGRRVLVVDADPQGTTTTATVGRTEKGAAEVLGYGTDSEDFDLSTILSDLIVRSEAYGFDLLGVDADKMAHQEVALRAKQHLMARFGELLDAVEDQYDFVLFDCPPSLDSLTTAVMYATDYVVVVLEAAKESIDSLAKLLRFIAGVKKLVRRDVPIAGAVITKAVPRTTLHQETIEGLQSTGRFPWIRTLYRTNAFPDAYANSKPVLEAFAGSKENAHRTAIADLQTLALSVDSLAPVAR